MIIMRYGIFMVAEEFFGTLSDIPDVDILRYRLVASPENLVGAESQSTLIIDLAQPESSIFNNFDKGNRYEIRRAETKDAIVCRLLRSHEITDATLAELTTHYRDLMKLKDLTPLNMQRLLCLKEQGLLFIGEIGNILAPQIINP